VRCTLQHPNHAFSRKISFGECVIRVLQCVAVYCSALQCVAGRRRVLKGVAMCWCCNAHRTTRFHTIEHPKIHCNTLDYAVFVMTHTTQHIATQCNILQHPEAPCFTMDDASSVRTYTNTLQHAAISTES